jgi:hypothetical protein
MRENRCHDRLADPGREIFCGEFAGYGVRWRGDSGPAAGGLAWSAQFGRQNLNKMPSLNRLENLHRLRGLNRQHDLNRLRGLNRARS